MTEEQIEAIRARCDSASPGPWTSDGEVTGWLSGTAPAVAVRWEPQKGRFFPVCMCQPHLSGPYGVAGTMKPVEDAAFIAGARQDIPLLLAEVERLQALQVLKPLKWEATRDGDFTADTVLGSFSVTQDIDWDEDKPLGTWKWGYCFDEYYDESSTECDGPEDGKQKAEAYYRERIAPAFEGGTP